VTPYGAPEREIPFSYVLPAGLEGPITDISTSFGNACVIDKGGRVKCWPLFYYEDVNPSEAAPVWGLDGSFTKILVTGKVDEADETACAISDSGSVFCWLYQHLPQRGLTGYGSTNPPFALAGLSGKAAAFFPVDGSLCVLADARSLQCWRDGLKKQPTGMEEFPDVAVLAGGYDHTCELTTGGAIACFGSSESAQLGTGLPGNEDVTSRDRRPVQGLDGGVQAIYAGNTFTCALTIRDGVQ
jgi:hypothetical protein